MLNIKISLINYPFFKIQNIFDNHCSDIYIGLNKTDPMAFVAQMSDVSRESLVKSWQSSNIFLAYIFKNAIIHKYHVY